MHLFHLLFLLLLEAAESVVQLTKGQRAVSLFSLLPHCQFRMREAKAPRSSPGRGPLEIVSSELCVATCLHGH